jgi:hypothetical protein
VGVRVQMLVAGAQDKVRNHDLVFFCRIGQKSTIVRSSDLEIARPRRIFGCAAIWEICNRILIARSED